MFGEVKVRKFVLAGQGQQDSMILVAGNPSGRAASGLLLMAGLSAQNVAHYAKMQSNRKLDTKLCKLFSPVKALRTRLCQPSALLSGLRGGDVPSERAQLHGRHV